MAPSISTAPTHQLAERQYGYPYGDYDCAYGGNCRYSAWYSWGRWVLLGVIIFVVLALFFISSCISSRRRRKRGTQPFYGTGWMSANHGPVHYYGPNGQNTAGQGQNGYGGYGGYQEGYQQAPPQYNQPTGNSNTGYYGGQQSGIELQQPQNVYAPPSGPPPAKN